MEAGVVGWVEAAAQRAMSGIVRQSEGCGLVVGGRSHPETRLARQTEPAGLRWTLAGFARSPNAHHRCAQGGRLTLRRLLAEACLPLATGPWVSRHPRATV